MTLLIVYPIITDNKIQEKGQPLQHALYCTHKEVALYDQSTTLSVDTHGFHLTALYIHEPERIC